MSVRVAPPARPEHRARGRTPTVGFVLEQTLGHVTHAANLEAIISQDPSIRPLWRRIPWEADGPAARIPGYGTNWTVRAGLRARRAIADMSRATSVDALFIHTQVPAVLADSWVRRIPTVVSVDATPLQYDTLGAFYAHDTGSTLIEQLKWRANRRCFSDAAHLVAWSHWAKAGLVQGYGVAPDRVTVIPPGVDAAAWRPPARPTREGPAVRILFVGGDLERKGGRLLLDAFDHLRRDMPDRANDLELHLVTHSVVEPRPGVTVHRGLTPNSPELKALYHRSAVFCLPTRGDCLPMVLSEAGGAGLPLVSTSVGAIPEIVRDGETGLVVPPDDLGALTAALRRLVDSPQLRTRMGRNAAAVVERDFDAVTNARRLVEVLTAAAHGDLAPVRPRQPRAGFRPTGDRRDRPGGRPVLLTVSGVIPDDVTEQVERGERPRPDYLVMADAFHAELMDYARARRMTGRSGALLERVAGAATLLAWACFRVRRRYRVVVTDGEQVGLPYALLCRLVRRRPRHHMIVHILSVAKKAMPFRLLGLARRIDTMFVYASAQRRFVEQRLGVPPDRVVLTPFMVDTAFFAPQEPFAPDKADGRRVICSAGLEWRDYPTLLEAVRGLDVHVVVAAASPWSKRGDTTADVDVPDNVEVCRLGFADLRRLYADSLFVVMPLTEVPFQAGVTTILEAMAMGKPVICSRTSGQTDVVVDGETGLYVPPGDAAALRAAIVALLDDPARAQRMGEAARRLAEERFEVRHYAHRLSRYLLNAVDEQGGEDSAQRQ